MDRPTLSIVGVDRNRSYFYWHWDEPVRDGKNVYTVDQGELRAALEKLAAAIPSRRSDETDKAMMTRVLTTGAFASLDEEKALSAELAALLLPEELARQIASNYIENGRRPVLLRLMPSALSAQVPWELFPIVVANSRGENETKRLIELCDIVQEVPAGVHAGRARVPSTWNADKGSTLFVVDPRTNLGDVASVLYDVGHEAFRGRVKEVGHPRSRVDDEFTRKHLHVALTAEDPPHRLVYVGHVIMSEDSPGSTALLLSDSYKTFGVTPIFNMVGRPLSGLDLLEGTKNSERRLQYMAANEGIARSDVQWPADRGLKQSGAEIWPMPPRVALIACNSGADLRSPEPFGLALALINAGAEIVTATKWTLPADRAYRELAGATTYPLLDTALALDDAHSANDPIARIAMWQREQLHEWELGNRSATASPLLWAAFSTYLGAEREVETAEPEHDREDELETSRAS